VQQHFNIPASTVDEEFWWATFLKTIRRSCVKSNPDMQLIPT
jgi:hypothetical protein